MIKLTANPSEQYLDKALEALDVLANENGPGNDFLGWKKLPTTTPESLFEECDEVVKNWKDKTFLNLEAMAFHRVLPVVASLVY